MLIVKKGDVLPDKIREIINSQIDGALAGMVFLMARNDDIVFHEAFGYADIENNIRMEPDSRFLIASVTKQFTAMGILVLINQGKLNYDTKHNKGV